jgi:hypothetical protein
MLQKHNEYLEDERIKFINQRDDALDQLDEKTTYPEFSGI